MKKSALLLVLLAAFTLFWGCNLMSEEDKDTGPDQSEDELTQQAESDLQDLIDSMTGDTGPEDPDAAVNSILQMDETFDTLLAANPNNYLGNTGKAMTSIMSLYDNTEVQALGTEMYYVFTTSMSGGMNSFNIIPELSVSRSITLGDGTTIDDVALMTNTVIPAVDEAIGYMETAIENIGDESLLLVDPDNETVEVDKSDLMLMLTALYGLKGQLHMSIVIDNELIDPYDGEPLSPYEISYYASQAEYYEDFLLDTLAYNVTPSEDYEGNFLGFKHKESLAAAKNAYLAAADAAAAFYTNIMAETDDQADDLLPNDNIEIDPEFFDMVNGGLSYAGIEDTITTVPELAAFVKDVINGDVSAELLIPGDTQDYSLTVTPGAFFTWDTTTENAFRDFAVEFDGGTGAPVFPADFDFTMGGIFADGDLSEEIVNSMLAELMVFMGGTEEVAAEEL